MGCSRVRHYVRGEVARGMQRDAMLGDMLGRVRDALEGIGRALESDDHPLRERRKVGARRGVQIALPVLCLTQSTVPSSAKS